MKCKVKIKIVALADITGNAAVKAFAGLNPHAKIVRTKDGLRSESDPTRLKVPKGWRIVKSCLCNAPASGIHVVIPIFGKSGYRYCTRSTVQTTGKQVSGGQLPASVLADVLIALNPNCEKAGPTAVRTYKPERLFVLEGWEIEYKKGFFRRYVVLTAGSKEVRIVVR